MYLTPAEKDHFFSRYDYFIWKVVHRFKNRISYTVANEEDLYQECAIVLLDHAQKAQDNRALHSLPIRSMLNAMCRYVIRSQAVSYPVRTTDFSRTIHSAGSTVEYSSLEDEAMEASIDDVLTHIDFEAFHASLPPEDSKILHLKRQCRTNREVARTLGTTDVAVTRRLKRIRHHYSAYETEE